MSAQHFEVLNHAAIDKTIESDMHMMKRLRFLPPFEWETFKYHTQPRRVMHAYAGIDQAEVYVILRKLPSQERASLSQQYHQFNPHECYRASVPRKSLHLPIPTSPDATRRSSLLIDSDLFWKIC